MELMDLIAPGITLLQNKTYDLMGVRVKNMEVKNLDKDEIASFIASCDRNISMRKGNLLDWVENRKMISGNQRVFTRT